MLARFIGQRQSLSGAAHSSQEGKSEEEKKEAEPKSANLVQPHKPKPRLGKSGDNYEAPVDDIGPDTLRQECGMER